MSRVPAQEPPPVEEQFRHHLRWAVVWPVVAFFAAAGVLVALVLYVQDVNTWVDHTDVVIGRANLVERLFVDDQSVLRGHLLREDGASLDAFYLVDERLSHVLDDLERLVGDSPAQTAQLEAVREALARWRQYAERKLSHRSDADARDGPLDVLDGEATSNDLRSRLNEFIEVEEGLRIRRLARAEAVTRVAVLLALVFAFVLGPALAFTTARHMGRARRKYLEAIAAQERTARSLRQSEEKLRLAEEAAKMGAWNWDLSTGELVWSDRCKAIFGLAADAALSYPVFLAAIHPEDRERVDRAVKDALARQAPYEAEMRVPRPDGSVRWIAARGKAFYRDGRPVRMSGMAMDVTARRSAEEERRGIEERFRAVVEQASDAFFIHDFEGRFLDVNRRACESLGYTRQELLRMGVRDVEPRFDLARARAQWTSIRPGQPITVFGESRRRDGTVFPVEIRVGRIEHGTQTVLLAVSRDITERKRAEDALRESDRRKDEFLGMLSHELRNPLAPIRNSVHVLGHAEPASEQAQRARAIIGRQVEHLARLVDDLLDVKRISTGKLRLHPEDMDLAQQVRETVEDVRALFASRSRTLGLETPEEAVWVHGDRTRLAQVVSNLLQNAAKFTDVGGHVSVRVERGPGQASIRVRDDGVGVPPEMLDRMFDPFVQSESTLHRTRGGLGLGLSLVKGIAELHGGGVVARSEGAGKGTEFVVTLPTIERQIAPAASTPASTPAPAVAPAASARRRVLIIEDNADAAESLRDVLELVGGHEVHVAHDGEAGVAAARRHAPDVILCDIGLPLIDGYEVARRLRADGATAGVRLIALSGYASPADVDRAIRAGFDDHVAKPPDIDRVLRLVEEAPGGAARTGDRSLLAS